MNELPSVDVNITAASVFRSNGALCTLTDDGKFVVDPKAVSDDFPIQLLSVAGIKVVPVRDLVVKMRENGKQVPDFVEKRHFFPIRPDVGKWL